MKKDSRIFVAGHRGLVGSSILRKLQNSNYTNILIATKEELDLTRQQEVENWFKEYKPEYVFLAAAKVGGIGANSNFQADFFTKNIQIQTNVIQSSYINEVKKFLFLGSSCIYPRLADQPIKESYLMSGPLEPTNSGYAIAKIAGIEMCQKYKEQFGFNAISLMPTNLYGPNDNFDIEEGHVLPALIAKFEYAKKNNINEVVCWGDGSPRREFLYVDDLADAAVWAMNEYDNSEIINVGTGKDITIKDLVYLIKETTEYKGNIVWNKDKPNGTPRKLLDVSKINNLGWKSKIEIEKGLRDTIEWYRKMEQK